MSVNLTGLHMQIGESLKSYVEDKISEAVEKFGNNKFTCEVFFEKFSSGSIDTRIKLDVIKGKQFFAEDSDKDSDAYASFNKALKHLEIQLGKEHERKVDHK